MWLDDARRKLIQEKLQSAMVSWLKNWSFVFNECQVEPSTAGNPSEYDYFSDDKQALLAISQEKAPIIKHWLYGEGKFRVPDDEVGQQLICFASDDLLQSMVSAFASITTLKPAEINAAMSICQAESECVPALWWLIEVGGAHLKVGLSADLLLSEYKPRIANTLNPRKQATGCEVLTVDVMVPLSQIPLAQMIGIQPGDVIASNVKLNQPLRVNLKGKTVLHGYLGTSGTKKALHLTSIEK